MIYGRMWTVVKPSVGLPLFFGFAATTALIVHIGILTHTTWYPGYLNGNKLSKTSEITTSAPKLAALPQGGVTVASVAQQ